MPTGFEDLDKLLAGLHPGDLCILAARPSVGKTALALNIAVNAAQDRRVGRDLLARDVRRAARPARAVLRGAHQPAGRAHRLRQGRRTGTRSTRRWASSPTLDFWVDDTPAISILEVRAKARRQLRDKEKGLIIVDYLQLMQPQQGRRSENRQVEIAEISRGLKILAKELDVPVLALSQLSRAVEQRAGKRPQLSDLRESGAIEQDADVVMFIDRNTDPRERGRGAAARRGHRRAHRRQAP